MRALRTFWAAAVVGGLLLAVGSAFLLAAYERNAADGAPTAWTGEGGTILMGCGSIFDSCESFDPTPWYAAGSVLIAAAVGSLAVASRARARA
jgi:hypothetical protein